MLVVVWACSASGPVGGLPLAIQIAVQYDNVC